MRITILTLFPSMFDGFLNTSIIKRAIENNKVTIELCNIRDYTNEKHGHVDDTPFGGGQGMILRVQPVLDALKAIKTEGSYVILMGPSGNKFNQKTAHRYVNDVQHLIIICGHYEGIDYRIKDYIDEEISIGDYIITGGELASMIISDACTRLLDGVIVEESHQDESFENGLLEYPQYTKPSIYDGKEVPQVLLSGHHENIRKYRIKESLRITKKNRPDLLENRLFSKEELRFLEEIDNENK